MPEAIAIAALDREIDRRRRAALHSAQLAQIDRLAEPAGGLADHHDRIALALEGDRRRLLEIIEHADAADRWRRQDRAPVGLVVERDVARDDRERERLAGFRNAADTSDELAHDLRPLRIAEVEIVGD